MTLPYIREHPANAKRERQLLLQLRFVRALVVINLKTAVASRSKFWLQLSFMAINNATFLVFWWVLFSRVQDLRGWKLDDVLLLYGISASGIGLMQGFAGGVRHLSRFIDNGELDPLLVQPKATWLYAIGSRSQPSGFGDLLSGIAFMLASGHVHLGNAALVVLCSLASACVFTGASLAFYSLAFWLRHTEALSRQALDFTVMFSLYPESLFTGFERILLFSVLPAGFASYVPVHVVRDGSLSEVPLLLAAALSFLCIGVWVFERGLRRYSSGSRFGVWG